MSNMLAKVKFMPGTSLVDAVREAKNKAILWDVKKVEFCFNGKYFSIGKSADIEKCVKAYQDGADFIFS